MTVEEIPADKLIKMTKSFFRAFETTGCTPTCHCCGEIIGWGNLFKLATVDTYGRKTSNSGINIHASEETREVMLCDICTVEKMEKLTKSRREELRKYMASSSGGCYRVNGKIIH